MTDAAVDPIRVTIEVDCPPAAAFDVWTRRISTWWPRTHTVSAEPGLTVVLEPRPGGRIFERTPDGVEHEWGRVVAWEPPGRLVYAWHLRVDRADATEVEIRFLTAADAGRTRVEIEHRGWERLGATGPGRRAGNLAGWDGLLPHFAAAARAELR